MRVWRLFWVWLCHRLFWVWLCHRRFQIQQLAACKGWEGEREVGENGPPRPGTLKL